MGNGREECRQERKNHLFLDRMRENQGRTFRVPLIIRALKDYILKVKWTDCLGIINKV